MKVVQSLRPVFHCTYHISRSLVLSRFWWRGARFSLKLQNDADNTSDKYYVYKAPGCKYRRAQKLKVYIYIYDTERIQTNPEGYRANINKPRRSC